jgi:hypothetical protein
MSGAVFLSYAREDAAAAQRIAEALRAFGVSAWFDQGELRGGDAWDQNIRRQIKECALFVPIISAHTQARGEGYFRLEWTLAEERAKHIAKGVPFIVPVAIDDISEARASVPDAFLHSQWTRMPNGAPSTQFVEHVQRLLSKSHRPAPQAGAAAGDPGPPAHPATWWRGLRAMLAAAVLVLVAGVVWWKLPPRGAASGPSGPLVVVLMDTPAADRVYDPDTRKNGGTNADDITDVLHDLPIKIVKENTGWLWRRESEVVKENPALIVMHRSLFYTFSNDDNRSDDLYPHADDKLVAFLGYVATVSPRTKFIIYSRHSWDNDSEAARWRENATNRFPALAGRIETWRVPLDRATFRNPLTGQELKDSVEKALGLKVASQPKSDP